jgi:hypothetical protein
MRTWMLGSALALVVVAAPVRAAMAAEAVVVTSSNDANNALLVFDATGALVQSVPTQGQGGASGRAGGIATRNGSVAVVNFGSQSVSLFDRDRDGFGLRQVVTTLSSPVSVAYGQDHLYVLGTTTIESHRIDQNGVDPIADGDAPLVLADGSAAQVGVVGESLVISEKSGAIETVALRGGAIAHDPSSLALPAAALATPFGLVTRGSTAYITVAGSDEVLLLRNGELRAMAATGVPNGPGQQAPCWIAVVGPYLFTANSPSHSISRLVTTGQQLRLDAPVAAATVGAAIDITVDVDLLAVVDTANGISRVTQFHIDEDGNLLQSAISTVQSAANGVAIVPVR